MGMGMGKRRCLWIVSRGWYGGFSRPFRRLFCAALYDWEMMSGTGYRNGEDGVQDSRSSL